MKQLFVNRHRYSAFLKLSWAIILIILTTFVAVLAAFYMFFYNVYLDYNAEQINQYHASVSKDLASYSRNMTGISLQLLNNEYVSDIIMSSSQDIDTQKKALYYISTLKSVNTDLNSIYIFNLKTNYGWSGSTMSKYPIEQLTSNNVLLNDIIEKYRQSSSLHAELHSEINNSVWFFYKDYRDFLVVIGCPYDSFVTKHSKNFFHNSLKSWFYEKNGNLFITDGKADPSFNVDKILEKINASDKNFDCFKFNKDFYIYNVNNDYISLSSLSYASLLQDAFKKAAFVWLLILVFLLCAGILTYCFSKSFKVVVNDYLKQLNLVNDDLNALKVNTNLLKIFTNSVLGEKEKASISHLLDIKANQKSRILIMQVDNFDSLLQDNSLNDIQVFKTRMNNIAQSYLAQYYTYHSTFINNDTIGIVLSSPRFDKNVFISLLKTINNAISKYWGVSITFTFSKDCLDFSETINQASACMKASKLRFLTGYNSIIDTEKYNMELESSPYPLSIQDKIIQALKALNEELFYSSLTEFKQYMQSSNCSSSREWLIMLFVNISRDCNLFSLDSIDFDKIYRSNTIDEAIDLLIEISKEHTYQGQKDANSDTNNDLVFKKKVEKLVLLNYRNANYSLGDMATELKLSTAYTGRKIRQVFNCSFNNYLKDQRINVALELLAKTNKKIAAISDFCGFNSVTYFNNVFKKVTQMTPQEYREMIKNKPV